MNQEKAILIGQLTKQRFTGDESYGLKGKKIVSFSVKPEFLLFDNLKNFWMDAIKSGEADEIFPHKIAKFVNDIGGFSESKCLKIY